MGFIAYSAPPLLSWVVICPEYGVAKWSFPMSSASDLLERHLQTLVADPAHWQSLIADDIVWEFAYSPAIGHPARLTGRNAVIRHVTWFLGAV